MVFGGGLFYSFLYPLPYAQQLPRVQSIEVVDLDGSNLSRQLIRMVDATPQVQVSRFAYSINQARQSIEEDGLVGMLLLSGSLKTYSADGLFGMTNDYSFPGYIS